MSLWLFVLILFVCVKVSESDGETCPEGVERIHRNTPSVFDQLTGLEITQVLKYLKENLNVTTSTEATVSDTIAYVIEKTPGPKVDVLAYIDNNGPLPSREARVVLATPRGMMEYSVGPLPNPTQHSKSGNRKWSRTNLRFTDRPAFTSGDVEAAFKIGYIEGRTLKQLLEESFNGFNMEDDCGDKCISVDAMRSSVHQGNRVMWIYFQREIPDVSLGFNRLYRLPLQMMLNLTSPDPDRWGVIKIWYNGQLFDSSNELMAKYSKGTVRKVTTSFDDSDRFSSMKQRLNQYTATNNNRGPDCFPQDGRRYSIDGHRVKYMNWQFEFTNRQTTGPQLFDIRFNNERIVYELSAQEQLLSYTGRTPFGQNGNVYLDSLVLSGKSISPLAPGIDCPKGATYFNNVFYSYDVGTGVEVPNSFCLFEFADGHPLRRHYESDYNAGYTFYAGMPNNALVLRTMQNVGNYDYMFDFIFYQNGVMATKVSASGYVIVESINQKHSIQNSGFEIHENVFALLHQHLFNFKVDMDILGTQNRHETLAVKARPMTQNVGDGIQDHTYEQYIKKILKRSETEAAYKFKFEKPKYYIFYNNNATMSKMGNKRAYYLDNQGGSKFLFPDNWSKMSSVAWAKYQLAVTRRHEDEDTSSTIYNSYDQDDPVLNFDTYISDDENIKDEDLVAWVTLGLQHLPNTATDIPVTTTPSTARSFYLKPFNYFDEDPSMGSYDNVFITPGENGQPATIDENENNKKENCCPPKDDPQFVGVYTKL